MIDVSHKPTTLRAVTARAMLTAAPATIDPIKEGTVPKGDCLEVARATAALAVKNAPDALLPGVIHAFKMLRGGGHEDDPRSGS